MHQYKGFHPICLFCCAAAQMQKSLHEIMIVSVSYLLGNCLCSKYALNIFIFADMNHIVDKGGLISEGILTLVTLTKKGAKSRPSAESLNFPPFTVNNLLKLSAQGRDLAPFLSMLPKQK